MASPERAELERTGVQRRVDDAREFLVIVLAGELYAVELARVKEILATPKIVAVPRAASPIIGICSVRGLLVTVVDLRARLALPRAPIARASRVLLSYGASGEVLGLLVDGVRDVVRLPSHEIEPTTTALGHDLSEAILGIGRARSETLVLLDLAAIVD